VVSSLVWLWWVIDLTRFEFESGTVSFGLLLSLFHLENHVCLSRGMQVAGAAWRAAMRIMVGVGDLVQRTRDGRIGQVLGGQVIERSGDTMCGLHLACGDEECGFHGSASKPRSTICQWFCLKTTGTVCEWFGLKTTQTVFTDLTSKPVVTVRVLHRHCSMRFTRRYCLAPSHLSAGCRQSIFLRFQLALDLVFSAAWAPTWVFWTAPSVSSCSREEHRARFVFLLMHCRCLMKYSWGGEESCCLILVDLEPSDQRFEFFSSCCTLVLVFRTHP
jgi:hypothetical protein